MAGLVFRVILILVIYFKLLDELGGVEGDTVEMGEDPFGIRVYPGPGNPGDL